MVYLLVAFNLVCDLGFLNISYNKFHFIYLFKKKKACRDRQAFLYILFKKKYNIDELLTTFDVNCSTTKYFLKKNSYCFIECQK